MPKNKKTAVLWLATCSALVCGQGTPPQQRPPDPAQAGSLQGKVIDSTGGQPLARASLLLERVGSPRVYSTSTGADGKFSITGIQAGSYRLAGEREGYPTQYFPKDGNYGQMATITINPASDVSGLEFRLVRQSAIAGRIFDDNGEPLGGVQVRLFQKAYTFGWLTMLAPGSATTNGNGEFWIGGLKPGKYYVQARRFHAPLIRPADGQRPPEGIATQLYSGVTDLASATALDLKPGQQLAGIEMSLKRVPVFRVTGIITSAPEPLDGFQLELVPPTSDLLGGGFTVIRRNNDQFEAVGVPSGSYSLVARKRGQTYGLQQVLVADSDVEGVSLQLSPLFSVRGRFVVEGTSTQASAPPGAGTMPAHKNGSPAATPPALTPALNLMPFEPGIKQMNVPSQKDDTFVIKDVGLDQYHVAIRGVADDLYVKSVKLGDADVTESGIDFRNLSASVLIEITLSAAGATLEGDVQDDVKPPSGAIVALIPDSISVGRTDRLKIARTDDAGHFKIQGIAPGTYKVYSWDSVDSSVYRDPDLLSPYESAGVRVDATERGSVNVQLKLLHGIAP